MHVSSYGNPDAPLVVFGHGWNRAGSDFLGVAEVLGQQAHCLMLDLPGFGETPRPADTWSTQHYASAVADFLSKLDRPYVWVGHSFGGRIGLRLGAMEAPGLRSMLLVGPAGLARQRQGQELWRFWLRKYGYRVLKALADSKGREALRQRFSSSDYLARPDMQDIFVATVQEDQRDSAAKIKVPVSILVGALDAEAPPDIARRLHGLIEGSELIELPAVGHLDILTRSRHLLAKVVLEHLAQAQAEEGRL